MSQSLHCSPPREEIKEDKFDVNINNEGVCTLYMCVHLTLRRIKGFSGVSGLPSLSLSASSNISVTYRMTREKNYKETNEARGASTETGDASLMKITECYLCKAQILHLLFNLRRIRSEKVFIVSQNHILNEKLTHGL